MKTIRKIAIVVGVSLALFALGSTKARAQAIESPGFTGTFTLPAETHWGAMTLPAGDYTLRYGTAFSSTYLVTVANEAGEGILGMILPGARDDAKAADNALNCVREGDRLYVRALELPSMGESVHFKIPHGVEVRSRVVAKHQSESGNTRMAEVRITVEQVPIKLSGK
jgi:hypothetical protein